MTAARRFEVTLSVTFEVEALDEYDAEYEANEYAATTDLIFDSIRVEEVLA